MFKLSRIEDRILSSPLTTPASIVTVAALGLLGIRIEPLSLLWDVVLFAMFFLFLVGFAGEVHQRRKTRRDDH